MKFNPSEFIKLRENIINLAESAKVAHHVEEEDNFYSCSKVKNLSSVKCTCGADHHNSAIDENLKLTLDQFNKVYTME